MADSSAIAHLSAGDAKTKYRSWCKSMPDLPLFDQDWWLDAVCGGDDRWDVVVVERDGEIAAAMPYYARKKKMFTVMEMPQLTLTMGVSIKYREGLSYADRLAYERDIYKELIGRMPHADYFKQQFHWSNTNWSSFYWSGYRQTPRITYMLEDISDPEAVYAGFTASVREDIRRAEESGMTVAESDDLDRFQEHNAKMFDPPNFTMPYSYDALKRLDESCKRRGCRKILFAVDAAGEVRCAMYLVWDASCAYYLLGGNDPKADDGGAHALLVWHAIRLMSPLRKRFDFQGGMHEPIERIYRSFGAVQKPYYQVSKMNGKLFKFAYHLKEAIR